MKDMTPPTPAAIRAVMKERASDCTEAESQAFVADPRFTEDIFRDHIRAVCAEMRAEADDFTGGDDLLPIRLREIADRLEGRGP